jgi:hypothetical protein
MADSKNIHSYDLNTANSISPSPADIKRSLSTDQIQDENMPQPDDNPSPSPMAPVSTPSPHRSTLRITMIILALYLSLFIAALDATIVSTAIPTITSDLNSPSGYAWIGGAYLIANAAVAPIWARVSDM